MREKPGARLVRMTAIETQYWLAGIYPGGVDEAGRGPLAGPVAAACAVMPPEPLIVGVNDSKKLTTRRREKLFDEITETALSYAITLVDVGEIDEINIREASREAMAMAVAEAEPEAVIVDYERELNVSCPQEALVHGDAVSYCVAAASILAKVYRDRLMMELDAIYPVYGFARNKGYGTREHIAALRKYGPCPAHRKLFIRKYV